MNKEIFVNELKKLKIEVTEEKLNKLNRFYQLLLEWNEKINLTTIVSYEEVYLKHFYDSLTLVKVIDLNDNLTLCDVGSGAGFPGIVLKIFFPNLKVTLIDSLNKRVIYLNDVIKKLNLNGIEAIHSRMEDYAKINEEKFDIITARAVANIRILSEISVRALKIEGNLIFMKANCDEELKEMENVLKKLSLSLIDVKKFKLPIENSNRSLVVMMKNEHTSKKFPRSIDKIKRNPL